MVGGWLVVSWRLVGCKVEGAAVHRQAAKNPSLHPPEPADGGPGRVLDHDEVEGGEQVVGQHRGVAPRVEAQVGGCSHDGTCGGVGVGPAGGWVSGLGLDEQTGSRKSLTLCNGAAPISSSTSAEQHHDAQSVLASLSALDAAFQS